MKYALLIYEKPGALDGVGEQERSDMYGEYMALAEDSRCLSGAQLQPVTTATTVRVKNGNTLTTDGPFADTKEVFGGYYVFDAGDLDEALELAAPHPGRPLRRLGRDASGRGAITPDDRAGLPRRVGPRPRSPGGVPRRLRARRGCRPGRVHDRGRALAEGGRAPPTPEAGSWRPPATGRSTAFAAPARLPRRALARRAEAAEDDE